MKKLMMILAVLVMAVGTAVAREFSTTDINVLPAKARTLITNTFKQKVNHIKVDKKTFGSDEYDVILTNGSEIEFDAEGSWKSVDCGINAVPASLVPKAIAQYVKSNFKGAKIVEIEIDRRTYEVQLSNGIELEFDRSGRFLKADH